MDRRPIVKELLNKHKENSPLNKSEAENYFQNLMAFGVLNEKELNETEDQAWEWFYSTIDEDNTSEVNEKIEQLHKAQLAALARVKSREDQKLDPAPHP